MSERIDDRHQDAPRAVDPHAFLSDYDARHHHVDLRRWAGTVVGTVDASLLERAMAWADGEGATAVIDGVVPEPVTVARGTRLRLHAGESTAAVTEVRMGTDAAVVARREGWCRIASGPERYLGWLRAGDLAPAGYGATHRVRALRGHLYAAPRVQADVLAPVAWGDLVRVREGSSEWSEVRLPDGRAAFLPGDLLAPLDESPGGSPTRDWSAFLGTPYLWGGGSAWGIDCSGFTQLLYRMAGVDLPRDADEQFAAGTPVDEPRAGDLVCFRGHVGLYLGEDRMAHASGRAMRVIESAPFPTDEDRERFLGWVRVT